MEVAMNDNSKSSDDSRGPLLAKSSAPKVKELDKDAASDRLEEAKESQKERALNVTAEWPHPKKKRLARRRRRSASKRRKSHDRRALAQPEDEAVPQGTKQSSPPSQRKNRKSRRRSRNTKDNQTELVKECHGGSQGRRATEHTDGIDQGPEMKTAFSDTRQDPSRPRELVQKSSTGLSSRGQDHTTDAGKPKDAPAAPDSVQRIPDFAGKPAPSSPTHDIDQGVAADDLRRKQSFLEQAQPGSTSTEVRLPSVQLQRPEAAAGKEIPQPVHVHGLENAPQHRSLPLDSTESASEAANASHHRLTLLSHGLLSNSVRDLGTSFFQSNPLVSLMRRASRSATISQSTAGSRISHASKARDDDDHGQVSAKSSAYHPTVAVTTDRARLRRGQVRPLCFTVTVVATLVAVTLLFLLLATMRDGRGPKAFEEVGASRFRLEHLCSIEACRRAVDALIENMLEWNGASSCAEFGKQVCGGWTKHFAHRRSFEKEALEQSTERLHAAMLQISESGNGSTGSKGESNMAIFYKSCLGFLMHEQVTRASDVLSALNFSADVLRSIETQRDLFRFVVATSLRTGLPSVVSVKLRGVQLVLDAGRSLELALRHGDTKQYLVETLKDLQFGGDDNIISALLGIDASLTTWLNKVNKSHPLVTRHLGDLSVPFANVTWVDALNADVLSAHFPAFAATSFVLIRDEQLIYAALGAMSSADLKVARSYAVVLLLAQVIRYRYILGSSSATGYSLTPRSYECLSVTGSYFPAVFLPWSYAILAKKDASQKIKQMVEVMKQSFRTEVGLNEADLGQWSITVVGERNESHHNATLAATPTLIGTSAHYHEEQFLKNIVRASTESVGRDWDEDDDVDRQLQVSPQFKPSSPSSNGGAGHVISMSAALLTDPFLVGDPELTELDYGTVGVRVLALWLDAELRKNTPLRDTIGNLSSLCSADDSGKDPIINITGGSAAADNARLSDVATEWALRTALAASRATRRQPQLDPTPSLSETAERRVREEESVRDRVLLWRFCQSLCGDSSQAGLCDRTLFRVPGFSEAFGCRPPAASCVAAASAVGVDAVFYLS